MKNNEALKIYILSENICCFPSRKTPTEYPCVMTEGLLRPLSDHDSAYLILYSLHLARICFNLTLSILEMRCNPLKPFLNLLHRHITPIVIFDLTFAHYKYAGQEPLLAHAKR